MENYPIVGSYGTVTLVQDNLQLNLQQSAQLGQGVFGMFKSHGYKEKLDLGQLAMRVATIGEVSYNEVARLPTGNNRKEQRDLAWVMSLIANLYNDVGREQDTQKTESLPYILGQIFSDFHEVIPADISSRILYASSDPETSEYTKKQSGSDSRLLAVETIVLLPKSKRHEIFTEMAKLDPRQEGNAYNLFRIIAMNFYQRSSPYSGSMHILRNLTGEQATEKIIEVQEDLLELGDLIRSQF